MSNKDLKWMNRDHNAKTGLETLDMISNNSKLKTYSIDLMFGRPNLSNDAWKHELLSIIQRKCPSLPHLSLYELTPEKGTKLWKEDLNKLPSEDIKAEQYEIALETLSKFGLSRLTPIFFIHVMF